VRVRNAAQQLYYDEHNKLLTERIERDKELIFTKRIYHANHKAEKIMGFIQSDLNRLEGNEGIKYRVMKYANFISRIIYDMKWYDPPIHSIRSQIFRTNINDVIQFIATNLFERLSVGSTMFKISTIFDPNIPIIHVNEFVIWEIIEPIVQNSIVHNGTKPVNINIETAYDECNNVSTIRISDDGKGIDESLLQKNEEGIDLIFLENTSTKDKLGKNFGYGCFIAYNMAKRRCGWNLSVRNLPERGCEFMITINH
jgi:K+-sensing histidine kinase KdpD